MKQKQPSWLITLYDKNGAKTKFGSPVVTTTLMIFANNQEEAVQEARSKEPLFPDVYKIV